MSRPICAVLAGILILLTSVGCGYNKLQGLDEEVKSAWAEVLNQYQRRFDLIPTSSIRSKATRVTRGRPCKRLSRPGPR